jgi:hypothetical protein
LIARTETKFVSNEHYPRTRRSDVHRALCWLLVAGNVAFGLLALAMPRRIGELIDEPEDAVKRIAQKDLAAGLALAAARNKPVIPLAMNALADLKEGAGWLKTKPLIAAVPLLWALLAVAAILTREQGEEAAS